MHPRLAARVRLLAEEALNKNDPNDARAVAALVQDGARGNADDHCAVLKMSADAHPGYMTGIHADSL